VFYLVMKSLHGAPMTVDLLYDRLSLAMVRGQFLSNMDHHVTMVVVCEMTLGISAREVWRWDRVHGEFSLPWAGSEGDT
jgi:hypothetical protein